MLSSRREHELETLAKELNLDSDRCLVLPLDLEDNQYGFQSKVDCVLDRFEHIDVLINNAGISQRGLVKDTIYKVDSRLMNINYLGTITLTKAVLPVSRNTRVRFSSQRKIVSAFFLTVKQDMWLSFPPSLVMWVQHFVHHMQLLSMHYMDFSILFD